jgi:hypothetical protein
MKTYKHKLKRKKRILKGGSSYHKNITYINQSKEITLDNLIEICNSSSDYSIILNAKLKTITPDDYNKMCEMIDELIKNEEAEIKKRETKPISVRNGSVGKIVSAIEAKTKNLKFKTVATVVLATIKFKEQFKKHLIKMKHNVECYKQILSKFIKSMESMEGMEGMESKYIESINSITSEKINIEILEDTSISGEPSQNNYLNILKQAKLILNPQRGGGRITKKKQNKLSKKKNKKKTYKQSGGDMGIVAGVFLVILICGFIIKAVKGIDRQPQTHTQ